MPHTANLSHRRVKICLCRDELVLQALTEPQGQRETMEISVLLDRLVSPVSKDPRETTVFPEKSVKLALPDSQSVTHLEHTLCSLTKALATVREQWVTLEPVVFQESLGRL